MEKNQKLADKKMKAGKENLTTGIFQWSKDYVSGASNFSEAAKLYQSVGKFDKALEALNQLIACNEKLLDNWAVARNYEEILDINLKHHPQKSFEELKTIAFRGFQFFRMADSIDKGLLMLGKIAKVFIGKGQTKEGIQILKQAYQCSLEDEKSFKKKDLFHQIVQIYMESEIYSQVQRMYVELIETQKGVDCCQLGLIKIVLIIIQHEAKRAERQMYEISNLIPNFLESDECEVVDNMIKAYKKGDNEKFLKLTTKPEITSIYPVIIIKKLRQITVPSGGLKEEKLQNEEENIKQLLF